MHPRRLSLFAFLAFPFALGVAAGCGKGETVGQTFQDLGGSGGNSTGASAGQGGTSSGGAAGSSSGGVSGTAGSPMAGTSGAAGTGMGGTAGTAGAAGTAGTGGSVTCADDETEEEPNDSEATARDLGTINDDDDKGASFTGVLNGADDADWYKYHGVDNFPYTVDPTRTVSFMMAARICKYAQCENDSDPSVTCPGSTTTDTSPDGRKGCCGSGGFSIGIDCTGMDDNATVYIRIDEASADCVPYSVMYHY
jgi:hypothetical protein